MDIQFPYQTPPTPDEASTYTPSPEPEAPKTPFWKTKFFLGGVATLIIVVVGGGVGAWAYVRFSSPSVEVVMEKTIQAMQGVESFSARYSLASTISGEEQLGITQITAQGQGAIDVRDSETVRQYSKHDVTVALGADSPAAALGISSIAASIEERSVDPTASYLRFTKLPSLGIISLSPFENKWMKIDQSVAQSTVVGVDPSKISQWFKTLLSDPKLFASVGDLGSDTVQSTPTYHYRVRLSPDRVEYHVKELFRMVGHTPTLQEETQLRTTLTSTLPNTPMEVWIGKKDFRFARVMVPLSATPSESVSITGSVDLWLSGYNVPVAVEVPADARPIQDVVGEVFQIFGGSGSLPIPGIGSVAPTVPTAPTGPDTDFDGVSDAQERSIGSNIASSDTDADGIIDGDEVNKHRTDPRKADTDGDGLTEGEEILRWRTDPLKADTDGDKYTDGQEVRNGYDPIGPGKLPK